MVNVPPGSQTMARSGAGPGGADDGDRRVGAVIDSILS
jgi:hypothetical protein